MSRGRRTHGGVGPVDLIVSAVPLSQSKGEHVVDGVTCTCG
ncbi:MAG TPA: hypothetical protein VN200_00685 [Rhodoglobus sp.]|nr:hypothetical protein [Rhodoglobus sp.]